MAQLSAAIDGIAEACNALGTPVTGGNVSLYNETKGEGIYPTPVLGVVGIIEDVTKSVPSGFQYEGEAVIHLYPDIEESTPVNDISKVVFVEDEDDYSEEARQMFGSSEFARQAFGEFWGKPPILKLEDASNLHKLLVELATAGLVTSTQDVSDGGLAVTLAKACVKFGVGAEVNFTELLKLPIPTILFWEYANHIILTCKQSDVQKIKKLAETYHFISEEIGVTGAKTLSIAVNGTKHITSSIDDLIAPFSNALEAQLAAEVVTA
jgi:phosphoribosylformylglycinamidine synthase